MRRFRHLWLVGLALALVGCEDLTDLEVVNENNADAERALVDRFVEFGHRVIGCGRSAEAIGLLDSVHGQPHRFLLRDPELSRRHQPRELSVADRAAGRAVSEHDGFHVFGGVDSVEVGKPLTDLWCRLVCGEQPARTPSNPLPDLASRLVRPVLV